uniref:HAT C-terminal dimerisation domain-containing protein n=1 Tax=Astyanax mexicanus TaxID=7994 RepID=A0A3B1JNM5_ASTMX
TTYLLNYNPTFNSNPNAVCAFEMKVNLFATQLKKGNLTHFPTCQEAFLAFSARFGQFRNEQILKLCELQLFANAQKWISMFGSTYICEQMFSLMKLNKSPLRTRLTDENLQAVFRHATTSLEPDINQLVSERRCNISH